jgi:F0F1-type ATP synthase membrane subunit b/b'
MILILALVLLMPGSGVPAARGAQELLDRTLALVGGQPITLSDARAALALGLVRADQSADPIPGIAVQLVDRELILREVQRYAPAPPSESAVETRLEEIQKGLADAAAMTRVLDMYGFTAVRLRAWVRDDLRTQAYLAQRFASASTPTDAEIAQAYARSRAEFDKAGQTFEQAAPIVRDRLVAARRTELIADWVSDLRRRTDVVILSQ